MSRVGRLPITIPSGVEVKIDNNTAKIKGPKGKLARDIHPNIKAEVTDGSIIVTRPNDSRLNKSLHGVTRTLLNNMVTGVTEGYQKVLQIHGVGYRSILNGKNLTLHLGYSNPVEYPAPEGIEFEVKKNNEILVKGINKEMVGQIAAEIRDLRPPEPYKGKGIRYADEVVLRKSGKVATGEKK